MTKRVLGPGAKCGCEGTDACCELCCPEWDELCCPDALTVDTDEDETPEIEEDDE